jgi:phosphomannomutase
LVDVEAIRKSNFRVVIDCVNSVGGLIIPELLTALGVEHTVKIYCEPTGVFPHNPEPLPEHLTELSAAVTGNNADVGLPQTLMLTGWPLSMKTEVCLVKNTHLWQLPIIY